DVKVTYKVTTAGGRAAKTVNTTMQRMVKSQPRQIVDTTTFGLINVRTNGEKILLAALNEKSSTWNVVEIKPVPHANRPADDGSN
ncbi:MAG: hypothetical protein ACR2O6_13605, partial [Ilumatobacteraceae bacterium]